MSVAKNENRLFWIVVVIGILAGTGLVSGIYKFNEKVSRLEENYISLKEVTERNDALARERISVLEKLLETKINQTERNSEKYLNHAKEIMDLKLHSSSKFPVIERCLRK